MSAWFNPDLNVTVGICLLVPVCLPSLSINIPSPSVIFSHRLSLSARCCLPCSCFLALIDPKWTSPLCALPFSSSPQEGERFFAHIPPVLQLCLQPDARQPGIDEGAAWFTEVSHCHLISSSRLSAHCETCVNSDCSVYCEINIVTLT